MFTYSSISEHTNSITMQRGANLYNEQGVLDFNMSHTIESDEELDHFGNIVDLSMSYQLDHIKAEVKGSGAKRYHVSLVVDFEEGELVDSDCDCPAYLKFTGICKHCVASLIAYINHTDSVHLIAPTSSNLTYGEQLQLNVISKAKTSLPMKELLEKRATVMMLPFIQSDIKGQVILEPHVEIYAETIELSFKIGIDQMYVLKDVVAFHDTMKERRNHKYGKKLEFVHSMDAFTEESRVLVEFIQTWVSDDSNLFKHNPYYNFYPNYAYEYDRPRIKEMELSEEEFDEFLDMMGERQFHGKLNQHKYNMWTVSKKPKKQKLTIHSMRDGIEVKVTPEATFVTKRHLLFLEKNVIYRIERILYVGIEDFLHCMMEQDRNHFFIQSEDIPVFCRDLLHDLEQVYSVKKIDFDESNYLLESARFEVYLDMPQRDMVTCELLAYYGDLKYSVYKGISSKEILLRDHQKETLVAQAISPYFNAFNNTEYKMVLAQDDGLLYDLLTVGIPMMQDLGDVFISDSLKRINVYPSPKIEVGISLSGNLLELSVTADDMPYEQLIEILSKYNRKKKYFRLKSGEFVNIESDGVAALAELKQGLHLTDKQMKSQQISIPKYRALYLDSEFKEWKSLPVTKDKNFKSLIRNMKTVEDNDFELPIALEHILWEYQKHGFMWLKTLKHNGLGGILADDMGLGKTLQVIAFLASEFEEARLYAAGFRVLITCPASLVYNWSNEFEKFAPELHIIMMTGTVEERKEKLDTIGNNVILVTSYDLLKRDIDLYSEIEFDVQVIDEAQYIKNHNTQSSKAVKAVHAGFKLALTGTPIENRLSELWSIFDYLMPGLLYGYKQFKQEIEIPIIQNQDETAITRLKRMVHPFILRRKKQDVLKDLPDKIEKNMYAVLAGEQQLLYDAHVLRLKQLLEGQTEDEFKTGKIQVLAELMKLRQICCDPALLFDEYSAEAAKMELCLDLIQNAIEGGHKILLFSQFTSLLDRVQNRLQRDSISYYSITGSTPKKKRIDLVDSFNKDDTNVFCISLKAGGTGLNLTGADIVIHFDPWWNFAAQNQATDRAHRIGQRNVVSVYKLIVKGTIEDNIIKLQEQKKELADLILSGEGMIDTSFSKEELLEILS